MRNFSAHNENTRREMLDITGADSIEDLFGQIPEQARAAGLNLPDGLSEMEAQKVVRALARKNKTNYSLFLGAGVYNHFIPAAVGQIAQRFEFLTAYTPYQPEISQGTLQVMYEYQTMICRLTGMDVANASMYDAATACAEAVLMALRIKKSNKALVSKRINPEYAKVIETYAWAAGIEIDWREELPEDASQYGCVLVQNPDFYGELFSTLHTPHSALLIVCTNPMTLSVLKPPSEYGADIVVGDLQPLGAPMSFGGPHAGFMACREQYMRQLPGRIAGRTLDADGNQAFTLTLQTREQHIRREKATSNICSNQALIALCATVYLSLLGEKGFRQAGILSAKNAHMLAEKLSAKGLEVLSKNFFNEFVIKIDNSDKFLQDLKACGIIGGLKLDNERVLVCATEMNSEEEIEAYAAAAN